MALIELRDLSKTYDLGEVKVEALKRVSLDIREGEFVALIGPSGSGKATLMNTLGCLDRPTDGSYRLAGEEVAGLNPEQLAQIRSQRIGFVFQNFNLLSRTTALENVEVPLLYNRNCPRRERKRRATQVLQRVGLGNRMDHRPDQLSRGPQQRAAIPRALVNPPQILPCGQPTRHPHPPPTRRTILMPEQRSIAYRTPGHLPPAPIPDNVPPRTVSDLRPDTEEWPLSLDEAIRIALENAKIVRMLAGTTAVASGQTIYDPAITN